MGAVEGKGAGLDLRQADPAMDAGEVLGEEQVLRRLGREVVDDDYALAQLQGCLHGVGQSGAEVNVPPWHDQPINHYLNGVHFVAI